MKKKLFFLLQLIILLTFSSCEKGIHPVEVFAGLKIGDTESNFKGQMLANPKIKQINRGLENIIWINNEFYGQILYRSENGIISSISLYIIHIYDGKYYGTDFKSSNCIKKDTYDKALIFLSERFKSIDFNSLSVKEDFYHYFGSARYDEKQECGYIFMNWSIYDHLLKEKAKENF